MQYFIFYSLAAIAVTTAVLVVMLRRAVYSALALIACFGSMAGLFFQLGAQFIGAIQIIVYAGAIMVLFLFVIMLLDPESENLPPSRLKMLPFFALPLAGLFAYLVLSALPASVFSPVSWTPETGLTRTIAASLFRDYLLPFELTSILILVAVIGAVVLTKRPR